MRWFSVGFYRDGFVCFRWTKVSRNGRVGLFSSSLMNCVCGCKLFMSSIVRQLSKCLKFKAIRGDETDHRTFI